MYVLYMRTYNEYIEGVGKLFAAKKEEMISGLEQTAKRKMWLFFRLAAGYNLPTILEEAFISFALRMETTNNSETFVITYHSTRCLTQDAAI